MTHTEYWKEALSCALDEQGLLGQLTSEQVRLIAANLSISAEDEREVFSPPGNSFNSELERQQRELTTARKTSEAGLQRISDAYKNALAARMGVDPRKLAVNQSGYVEIWQ